MDIWPDNPLVSGFEGVLCQHDRLFFRITDTSYNRCTLRAIMSDGTTHPISERFWLAPEQALPLVLPLSNPSQGEHPVKKKSKVRIGHSILAL